MKKNLFLFALIGLGISGQALADVSLTDQCYNTIVDKARAVANEHIADSSDQYHDVLSFTSDNRTHYRVRLKGDDDAELFLVEVKITRTLPNGGVECQALSAHYVSGGGVIQSGG